MLISISEEIMNNKLRYITTSYTLHGVLLIMCAYAIGCCGFHILPVLGTAEDYDSINNTFLSLALSYVAGFIIYGLTSVLPKRRREKEVFELWKPHLSKLYNEMSERIGEIGAYLEIPKERMDSLTEEDCKPFEKYTSFPPIVSIAKVVVRDDPDNPLRVADYFSIKKTLNGHHDSALNLLDTMLNNPMAVDANRKLLDLLSQIKASAFLVECNRIMDISALDGAQVNITHSDLPKSFYDYVKMRDLLGAWPITKYVYDMRKRTPEEEKESQKQLNDLLAQQGLTPEQLKNWENKLFNASKR